MFFKYKAIKDGKIVVDKIEADSQGAVLKFLKNSDYFPISIWSIDLSTGSLFSFFFKRINFSDLVDLTRQLSIMLDTGLTLIDALDILKKQTTKPILFNLLEKLDKEIRSGRNFSAALSLYPQYFSNLYISLVKAGEASGKLSDVLIRLSDNLEKEKTFRGKLRGALIYPTFIVIGMIIVAIIMLTFVTPKLLELYQELETQLPLSTRILLYISSFFSKFWPILLIGSVLSITILIRYFKTSLGKLHLDSFLIKLPIVGNVIKMSALVDSTRTLSILASSGVSLMESLGIVVDTSTNIIYKRAFEKIRDQVEKGVSLGISMKQAEIFPPILVQMTLVGEQTGHLDESLLRVSRYFEIDSELAIKAMTTMIEPLILVVLGIGVGFLVFAVITPIYSLTSTIK